MNTEYAVGNIRLRFESRARRRRLVALFYAVLAVPVLALAGFFVGAKNATSQWVSVGCMVLWVVLWIVFSWLAGDMRRGDEREMRRRDHAHFMAYRFFLFVLMVALLASAFSGPNPIAPLLPLALRGGLTQLHFLTTAFLLYLTLPQAILLWTEPDMEQPQ
jgi:hypothetical protein